MTLTHTGDAPDDAALIARWRKGDERAATDLVERHARPLARFVASMGAREEVEELVQDTFVRAFASLDGFRAQSTLRTWLFTIARNLMRDRARAAKARTEESEIDDSHVATGHDALDQLVADETGVRLRAAIQCLTPLQRDVFTLRVTQGLSYREIAGVLGSTEGAARVHYFNAMRAIKDYIND
ncbi:MAG TPA: RNA polymerase sigma factor [Gemmatimonadaceae bacterium]|nr:RNA polymerase sigma factor [Gemmatimonadaceae bacterium]